MKQLLSLHSINSRERGFAFSIDATLAAILFLSVILVIISISSAPPSVSTLQVNQLASDLFFSLNKTGFILSALDTNAPSQSLSDIYNKSRSLLPPNFDLQLRLTQFDLNSVTCRQQKNFSGCFSQTYSATTGPLPPTQSGVFAGERVYIKRQPESSCDTNAQLSEYSLDAFYGELYFQTMDENFENLLIFDVNTVPEGEFACDQNILVTLSITVPENIRKPVDMMLVLDRSGSMSWSGNNDNQGPSNSIWADGNDAFVSISSYGVASYDASFPLIPVNLDVIDSGIINDVHGKPNTVLATDILGTDALYAYDSTDPSNLSTLHSLTFDSVYSVFVQGNYAYLAADRPGSGNNRGLYIVDISNPSNLQHRGRFNLTNAEEVFVSGNTAYVARLGDGISTLDVTNPDSIALLDTVDPGGTNNNVFVDGNYAYVAAGSLGLAVINVADANNISVASTLDTPGTAYSVFVSGSEAYIADDTSLFVANVSNPQAPSFARSFSTPYLYRDIFVQGDYALLATQTFSIITVDIFDGPRINNAQVAANDFVDFNGWKFPPDQIGLVSFSSSATTNRQLSSDGNSVKSAIDALVATGGTDIAAGINAATTELTSVRANPNALKFQILLSDGQSNQGDANVAAQNAANNNIIIYSIAFGADADSVLLSNVAQITGGKYYSAGDENALQEVFELISKDIEETARDANIVINLPSGELIIDEGSGYIVDGNIVFDANTLEPGVPWVGSYTVVFPCSHVANCGLEAVTFPGPNTKFNYIDSNGNNRSVDFNAETTVDFLGRDLSVEILDGEIISETEVLLDVNVSNTSDLNSGPTDLKFYLNDTNGQLLRTENVPALCGSNDDSCNYFNFELYNDTDVGQTGLIYAVINDQNTVSECPLHNIDSIYCLDAPKTQYYLLEYWVWKK